MNKGYIYVIHCKGTHFYKIGMTVTGSASERLSSMQTGCPYELVVIGETRVINPEDQEARIHAFFSDHRSRGEWFGFPDEEVWKLLFEIDLQCAENRNLALGWQLNAEEKLKYISDRSKRCAVNKLGKYINKAAEEATHGN